MHGLSELSRILLVLWLFNSVTSSTKNPSLDETCSPCSCTEGVMNCNLSNYDFIPLPDPDVTSVIFRGVDFNKTIFENFYNLTLIHLTGIVFSQCDLRYGILRLNNLTSLKYLEITDSKVFDDEIDSLLISLRNISLKTISVINSVQKVSNDSDFFLDVSKQPDLEQFILSENPIPAMTRMMLYSVSLKRLVLSDNGCKLFYNGIFSGSPLLELLDVSGNDFGQVSSSFISTVFSTNLEHLETLFMKSTNVRYLTSDTFSNLPSLQYLDLTGNFISQLPDGAFSRMPNLVWLNLSSNVLTSFNESALPLDVPLDISRNPFNCSCDLLWFLQAIAQHKFHLLGSPAIYVCASPAEVINKPLAELPIASENCTTIPESHKSIAVVVTSVVVSILVIVVLCIVSFYFRRAILNIFHRKESMPYYRMRPNANGK